MQPYCISQIIISVGGRKFANSANSSCLMVSGETAEKPQRSEAQLSERLASPETHRTSQRYRIEGVKGGTPGAPIMPRDAVSRTANVS